jgi:DNA-binding LytR/AlgR family response regulator
MNLTCIIVEDREIERDLMQSYIERMDVLELKSVFVNALEAQKYIMLYAPDLVISDIMLPDMTGLEMIKTLPNPPQVIFTTSFADYAVKGFELNATDYLVKPVSFERFVTAINKAVEQHSLRQNMMAKKTNPEADPDHFFIRSDFSYYKIPFEDIIYIESIKDYMRVVTTSHSHLTQMTLKAIEDILPPINFIHIHRSFLVNIKKIEFIKNDEVSVAGHLLPLSSGYKESVFQLVIGK